MLDGRFYRWLEALSRFLLLNVLWLVACLPLVTVFPATAAMFGVIRAWTRHKEDGVFRPFWKLFRENFAQGLVIGVVWTLLGAVLLLDLYVIGQMPPGARLVLGSLLFLLTLLYAFTSPYIFPVMVHYDARWPVLLKSAFLLSIGNLATTLFCLLVVAVAAGVATVAPLSLLITASPTAYVVYRLCDRTFGKAG